MAHRSRGHRAFVGSSLAVSLAGCLAACAAVIAQPAVTWTPLATGVSVRLRGVSAVSPHMAWVSGEKGTVLRTLDGGQTWQARPILDAAALDLRDIEARSDRVAIAMSAGPGDASRIYRTDDGGERWTQVFVASHPEMFLDAMAFTDDAHGVAFSDSADNAFVIVRTADGGRTWTRVPPSALPLPQPQEGAFAASGTNVVVRGRHIWIGTTRSRVLASHDDGATWSIVSTPMPTGEATGIFSIAFRDDAHGVAVGGTYSAERLAHHNVAVTDDAGSTWRLPRGTGVSGYRSVVAHLAGLGPRGWLAIGPSGSNVTVDDGDNWSPAGGDGYDAVSIAPDGRTGFASGAGGRVARVTIAR